MRRRCILLSVFRKLNSIRNSSNCFGFFFFPTDTDDKEMLRQLKRDQTVKDLTQKLSNLPSSPTTAAQEAANRAAMVGGMSGLISKAKEGLAKSKSKGEISR